MSYPVQWKMKWIDKWAWTRVLEFLFSADILVFKNFLVPKFLLFLLFSAYFCQFNPISHCFSSFFVCCPEAHTSVEHSQIDITSVLAECLNLSKSVQITGLSLLQIVDLIIWLWLHKNTPPGPDSYLPTWAFITVWYSLSLKHPSSLTT